ncbi:hypothetical protein SPPR111872_00140 [Sphingobacterium prati]
MPPVMNVKGDIISYDLKKEGVKIGTLITVK